MWRIKLIRWALLRAWHWTKQILKHNRHYEHF